MAGYRPPYTMSEEKKIVDYIVSNNEFYRLKGDKLWQNMAASEVVDRTWQSLKQHFRKKMIDQLHYTHYRLTVEMQETFRRYYHGSNGQPISRARSSRSPPGPRQNERRVADFMACSSGSSSSDSD